MELFDVRTGRYRWESLVADLHVRDQREGRKSKGSVFGGLNPRQEPLQKRKESHSQSSIFLSGGRVALPQSLLLLSPSSADTAKLKDCSYVFTEDSSPPIPSQIWGYSISTVSLWKQPSSWGTGEREKKHLWAVKLPCHPKRSHYWDKSPHSIP